MPTDHGAPESERATLDSVASRAGTSRQTVSNVINSPHLVKPETAARVRQAIDALDYRPSRAARELRTRRSGLIAARVEPGDGEFGGGVLDTFLHALTIAAETKGYRVILYAAADDDGEIAAHDELLRSLNVDAFVLTDTRAEDHRTVALTRRGIPFVTFGRPWDDLDAHPWIDVDGALGTAAAVDHLHERGHRRIGYLGWFHDRVGDDRRRGWHDAMAKHGLETDAIGTAPHDMEAGHLAASALLDQHTPTAIVCASDVVAFGAIQALRDRGNHLGTPNSVAVVGFDDTPAARVVGLSSVAQPVHEVATRCVDLLGALLGDGATPQQQLPEQHRLLAPRLAVRRSSNSARTGQPETGQPETGQTDD